MIKVEITYICNGNTNYETIKLDRDDLADLAIDKIRHRKGIKQANVTNVFFDEKFIEESLDDNEDYLTLHPTNFQLEQGDFFTNR